MTRRGNRHAADGQVARGRAARSSVPCWRAAGRLAPPGHAAGRVAHAALLCAALGALAACDGERGSVPPDAPAGTGAPRVEAPLGPADQALVERATQAVQDRRYEDVQPLLGPLLARDPPPANAQFVAGSAAYELGDHAEAVARLADACARKPDFVPSSAALGFAQFKLGDFAGARATFERIVAVRDGAYKAHYGLGLVALSEGRLTDARAHLERSLELQPGYLKARFQMARLLHEEGRLEEARAALQAVLDAWPTHEEALYRLAQVLSSLGQGERAAELALRHAAVYKARETIGGLVQRIRSGDDQPALHARIVELWLEVGDGEEASRALSDGLRRFPGDPQLEALRALGAPGAAEPPAKAAPPGAPR